MFDMLAFVWWAVIHVPCNRVSHVTSLWVVKRASLQVLALPPRPCPTRPAPSDLPHLPPLLSVLALVTTAEFRPKLRLLSLSASFTRVWLRCLVSRFYPHALTNGAYAECRTECESFRQASTDALRDGLAYEWRPDEANAQGRALRGGTCVPGDEDVRAASELDNDAATQRLQQWKGSDAQSLLLG
jgi:hypothetical protein